jgi:two-component system NtrC family sensor kinase
MPVFSLLSLASFYTGWMYFHSQKQYPGARMLGWGFMLWGVHLWGFGVQSLLPPSLLVPGYIGSGALALFIAMGMVVLVLEEAKDEHDLLADEFRKGLANRRQLEEEILVSEQRYRLLFNTASDAILVVDGESLEVLEANERAETLVGASDPEGKARKLAELFPDWREKLETTPGNRRGIEELFASSREFVLARANGSRVQCEGSANWVQCNQRSVLQIAFREITERKKLEQQLRQAEKLAALGQLVAGVAHELNNPLAVIMGYAQILAAQGYPANRVQSDLKKILHESERAAKIVRNLLTFSRPREPQLAPVDINQIVSNVVEAQEAEMESAAIQFHSRLARELPKTMADSHQIEQVMTNLITNAVQELSRHQGRRTIEVLTEQKENIICITVIDSGPGISRDVMPKIFDPFFTTKGPGKGTGLGLSLCYSIIQEHRGRILVESELGKGAKFLIELPLVRCDQFPTPETPSSSLPSSRGKGAVGETHRVLIVDDEPGIVDVLKSLLKESDCTVDGARNGVEALALIRQTQYDLIISDLCMPDLGGEALYRQVLEFSPLLARRIIFITGDTISGGSRQFLESTSNCWFGKPFNLGEIEKIVHRVLSETPVPALGVVRA